MKLLIIEDELKLLESIKKRLKIDGYYIDTASSSEQALDMADVESYDLVILDLNLSDMLGFDVLQELIIINKDIKIIVLTNNLDIKTRVKSLDLGASDCIIKPFDFEELEARIRVLLRRTFFVEKKYLCFGSLKFDTEKRSLQVKGSLVSLTKKESAIIEYFLLNQNRLIKAEELMAHAWDSQSDEFSNSVRVHLTMLRKKIKRILGYNVICNKVGEGYYLKENNSEIK